MTHKAVNHWNSQRNSALLLFILIPFAFIGLYAIKDLNYNQLLSLFSQPFLETMVFILISTSIYHAYLGLKVIVEDYVHCFYIKFSILNFLLFISIFLEIFSGFCLMKLMVLGIFS